MGQFEPGAFEKLGAFYLGREHDLERGAADGPLLLYDSKDLVTHAICVGMTGSGKTGLCIGLLEEAALDGVPAIIIDPKGDLTNLMLTFPELRPEDFLPWVNESDAGKSGQSVEQFAAGQAALWRKGLADWGQEASRVARLRSAAEFAIYTPGSSAGRPLSVLKSFDAPPDAVRDDPELLQERVGTTVGGLLGLVGLDADPIQSREHILLSNILHAAWSGGRGLGLGDVIARVQTPPFTRVGVLDLDAFYPATERFALAMRLNNLLAAPGFAAWMEGDALDIGALLHTPDGRPRVSIISIAHLGDAERMFVVGMILNEMLGWVRTQSGTTSLRAILYMDEIAGYFPPVANPPSKRPLLTLMKQARAFGVGVVLATQNPVDLDYKGLSNAGTWFIGRLQTEQDKARVLDGLEGAAAASGGFDRAGMERTLSRLGKRVFVMHNVHEDAPVVFQTRWCMSYLRGPLTRTQIRQLCAADLSTPRATPAAPANAVHPPALGPTPGPVPIPATNPPRATQSIAPGPSGEAPSVRPVLPPDVPQFFAPASPGAMYTPRVLGLATVHFSDARRGVEADRRVALAAEAREGPVPLSWDDAEEVEIEEESLRPQPEPGTRFAPLPVACADPRNYAAWKRTMVDTLYRTQKLDLLRCAALSVESTPEESEREFMLRVAQAAREARDGAVEKLRTKFTPRLQALQERLRRAEQAVEAQKAQASQARVQTAISFSAAVLGGLLGRKKLSSGSVGRAATAARGVGRSAKEAGDVGRAKDTAGSVQAQIDTLRAEFDREAAGAGAAYELNALAIDRVTIRPKKTLITVRAVVLAWMPA